MTREIDPKLADSEAARMLSAALSKASSEHGLSLRKIAPLVGYKQAVVLSHMATGRIPIPFEKAEKIAEVLGMNARDFLRAILKQRHPEVSWSLISGSEIEYSDDFLGGLAEGLNGQALTLNQDQLAVIREIAADPDPRRRWLSSEEAAAIEILRSAQATSESLGKPDLEAPPIPSRHPATSEQKR